MRFLKEIHEKYRIIDLRGLLQQEKSYMVLSNVLAKYLLKIDQSIFVSFLVCVSYSLGL